MSVRQTTTDWTTAEPSAPSDFAGLAERGRKTPGELHAETIAAATSDAIYAKYMRGQREHGGDLRRKAGMLAHVEDETRDQVVYLYTLREQMTDIRDRALALLTAIEKILGAPEQ